MSDDGEGHTTSTGEHPDIDGAPIDTAELVESITEFDEDVAANASELIGYIEELQDHLEHAQDEVEDLTSRLKRAHADFANYKKRKERERDTLKQQATRDIVERLVALRDDLRRATTTDDQTVDDLVEGIKLSLRDLDSILDAEDVEEISPSPGDAVDPHEHEVMLRIASDEQPEGTIAEVFDPGYRHGDRVLREAQVAVSTGKAEAESADDDEADSAE